jgi:hypothetical protein
MAHRGAARTIPWRVSNVRRGGNSLVSGMIGCTPSRQSAIGVPNKQGALMRYKVRSIAALQLALGSLPNKMRVEVDPGIEVSAKTVGELRKVTAWPENLAVTTPQERHADSAVKLSKVNVATRTVPKT